MKIQTVILVSLNAVLSQYRNIENAFDFQILKKWSELSLNIYFPTFAYLQVVGNLPL